MTDFISNTEFGVDRRGSFLVVEVREERFAPDEIAGYRDPGCEAMRAQVRDAESPVVVDLSGVLFVSREAWMVIFQLYKICTASNRAFAICGLCDVALEQCTTAHLDRLFTVHSTLDVATAAA